MQWLKQCHYGQWGWYTIETHKIILASTSLKLIQIVVESESGSNRVTESTIIVCIWPKLGKVKLTKCDKKNRLKQIINALVCTWPYRSTILTLSQNHGMFNRFSQIEYSCVPRSFVDISRWFSFKRIIS